MAMLRPVSNTNIPSQKTLIWRGRRGHWRSSTTTGGKCSFSRTLAATLEGILGRPLELTRFLNLGIAVTAALRQVHQHGLIHKDIKPANLLVDAAGNVRLTGFGIASRLPREHQAPAPPEVIAGTLAYMAPEQTGRMNRSIDARSDLYSLGVTLYEMLTGALPFTASDPMEWIHCHIARQPMPPRERVTASRSGRGHHLEAARQNRGGPLPDRRRRRGRPAAMPDGVGGARPHRPFALGAHDASDRLLIPEKLYGREAEIGALIAAFDRVVASGTTELVLVSGYSGIGKSSIVNELHKVLVPLARPVRRRQVRSVQARHPLRHPGAGLPEPGPPLLGKNDAELGRWRGALLEALGPERPAHGQPDPGARAHHR